MAKPWVLPLRAAGVASLCLAAALAVGAMPGSVARRGALEHFASTLVEDAAAFWDIVGPGGRLHPGWFLEHKGHLVIEGLLLCIIAVMLLQSRSYPRAREEDDGLTDRASSMRGRRHATCGGATLHTCFCCCCCRCQ